MQIRYRELKRASMDNRNWELCWFFQSENLKLSISPSRSFFQGFRSSSSQRPGISKYYEHRMTLANSSTLRAPWNPIWVFLIFLWVIFHTLTCKHGFKICPLSLGLTLKAARCIGDHVEISNSAGSSDSAEESSILLNQMVLTGCGPCTPTCHINAKMCPLTAKHVS